MDRAVMIKLDHDRTEELCRLYLNLVHNYEADTEHRQLLFAHIKDLHHRLKVMLVRRDQAKYTINLTDMEAIAFVQTWDEFAYDPTNWSCLIIKDISNKIYQHFADKRHLAVRA
jgi:hypothetical protein